MIYTPYYIQIQFKKKYVCQFNAVIQIITTGIFINCEKSRLNNKKK